MTFDIFSNTNSSNWIIMICIILALTGLSIYTTRFRKNPLKIIDNKNWFLTISGLICVILLGVIIYKFSTKTMNFSLEFTGGTMIEIGFPQSIEKSKISEIITKSVNSYNEEMKAKGLLDKELKTPTVQPEGSPRIMEYQNDMNTINMVLAKKNGTLTKEEVKGLSAVLFSRLPKIRVDENSIVEENGKVKYSFDVETSQELFTTEELDSEETSTEQVEQPKDEKANKDEEQKEVKRIVVLADPKNFEDILTSFNENLVLDSVTVSNPHKVDAKDTFNAAFVRIATVSSGKKVEDKPEENVKNKVTEDDVGLGDTEISHLLVKVTENSGNLYIFKKESIGPSIGKELSSKALLALVVALVLQLVYITIRFNKKWHYGAVADIGLFHDLVLMLGIYALMDLEFDSPFVSAMMTIIGYSVMNSIVIFDRIRENLRFLAGKSFPEIANTSCNQTMTRSVNTTLTVLITLFALYFFGGATLKNFAFALLIGCTAGAYSSIFLVPSLLALFETFVKNNTAFETEEEIEARKEAVEERRLKRLAKKRAEELAEELPPENEDDYIDKTKKARKEESDDDEEERPARRKRIIRRKRR